MVFKELGCLADVHRQHIGNRSLTISNSQGLAVESRAMAHRAGYFKVGKKIHGDSADTLPFASLASSAFGIEAKTAGAVAALPSLLCAGKHTANVVPHTCVGGRVTARRPTDRRLIDFDQALELAHAA